MYYIGTHQECINYDLQVTQGEKYSEGSNWANPIKSQSDPNIWAILKACPDTCPRTYNSAMQEVEILPSEFIHDVGV